MHVRNICYLIYNYLLNIKKKKTLPFKGVEAFDMYLLYILLKIKCYIENK